MVHGSVNRPGVKYTPRKIHMEPENHWVVKEHRLPKVNVHQFSVSMLFFSGGNACSSPYCSHEQPFTTPAIQLNDSLLWFPVFPGTHGPEPIPACSNGPKPPKTLVVRVPHEFGRDSSESRRISRTGCIEIGQVFRL